MKDPKEFELSVTPKGDVAYLRFPRKTIKVKVAKNIRLHEILDGYIGPDVIFDFDIEGKLLGIEVLLQ